MLGLLNIQCFLAVAKHMSFTAASGELFITQQAVSKKIKSLEGELGFSLFTRDGRRLSLTYAGEMYYKLFSEFISKYDEVSETVSRYYDPLKQGFRLGYQSDIILLETVLNAVEKFKSRLGPEGFSILRYSVENIIPALMNCEIDGAFVFESFLAGNRDLPRIPVATVENVVSISDRHPLAERARTALDLADEIFFVMSHDRAAPDISSQKEWINKLPLGDLVVSNVRLMPNLESLETAVAAGLGAGIFCNLSGFVARPEIISFPVNDERTSLVYVWNPQNKNIFCDSFARLLG